MKATASAEPRSRVEDAAAWPPAFTPRVEPTDDQGAARRAERIVGLVFWASLVASIVLALVA